MAGISKKEFDSREALKDKKPIVYSKVMKYEEKWNKKEPIPIIQLHTTRKCLLHCRHCSVSDLRKKKMDRILGINEYKSIGNQAHELGLAHIDLTGGEPFEDENFESVVEALDPTRFYLQVDTSGYRMTQDKINKISSMKIDKIQISIDNLNEKEHDDFRRKQGCWRDAINTIDYAKNANLKIQIATVADHNRIRSEEFIEFLEFMKKKDVGVSVVFPKLVGEWAGKYDLMVTQEDVEYTHKLSERYNIYDHLTAAYGRESQCLAAKRFCSILLDGSVIMCPWIPFSCGSIYASPLKDILSKGMKYFGKKQKLCLASESKEFIEKYISKTYGRSDLPVSIEEIMPNGGYEI